MEVKMTKCDFVLGNCESPEELNKLLDNWTATNRKTCLICRADKSKCNFYKNIVCNSDDKANVRTP